MNNNQTFVNVNVEKRVKTNYRWLICSLLFFATTINYMDRQVLSLTWKDYIAPEFHWTNEDYGNITAVFSLAYAISMLFVGKFVDFFGTKRGYIFSIGIWSLGACLHAVCGIMTEWMVGMPNAGALRDVVAGTEIASRISIISVTFFIMARLILAFGESGNFPAAIKTTAEYFPKKDRAFATSIFNSGATIGALIAPLSVPFIAQMFGWEMAFIIIGGLGFIWIGFWNFYYKKPEDNSKVNKYELEYIEQDMKSETPSEKKEESTAKLSIWRAFCYKQTWAFIAGKFMTDGVWWFFLFWLPAYLSSVYGLDSTQSAPQIITVYIITMLSIYGGWLPTYFVEKKKMEPYSGRMRAMLFFAFIPLLTLFAQPLGAYSVWIPVVIIGLAGAAHQSWSANIYSTIGDMFPKSTIATIIGIGSMAGGLSSALINKGSGLLFDYSENTNLSFGGFHGIEAGYFIIFSICGVSYLIGWIIMKMLVPKSKQVIIR